MPQQASFQRFTFRVVLLKVSPLVVRLVSVPDDLTLDEKPLPWLLGLRWRIGGRRLGRVARVLAESLS